MQESTDEHFLATLYSYGEEYSLHPVHVLLRRDILEVRRTRDSRKVFLQCACCAHLPRRDRARHAVFAPVGVKQLYRAFTRFQRNHVPKCEHIPSEVKLACSGYEAVGVEGTKAVKAFWERDAREKGLGDGEEGQVGAIYYRSS